MTIRYSATVRTNRMTQVLTALGSTPKLQIYSGSQPATPATGATGTLLAEITLAATPGTVTGGVLTITTPQSDNTSDASGIPGWASLVTSGNARIVDMSCSVGAGGDLVFSANIVQTGITTLSTLTLTDGSS